MEEYLTPLESEALDMILSAASPTVSSQLRAQLDCVAGVSVSDTGVGRVKRFQIAKRGLPATPSSGSFTLSNVGAEINDGDYYLTFMLFVKDGLLDVFEIAAVPEWPNDIKTYRLQYINKS